MTGMISEGIELRRLPSVACERVFDGSDLSCDGEFVDQDRGANGVEVRVIDGTPEPDPIGRWG
jgi:hypothetical protein